MLGYLDEYTAAVNYYDKIMTHDDVLLLANLVSRIPKAPADARQYLQRRCMDARGLEEFFRDNSHLFFVENGRVALNDDELETARNNAVEYFRSKLDCYEGPIHYMKLKEKHMDEAPDNIGNFISRFYPGKEFKHFLRSRPDVFVLHKDHTVFLIEIDSVAFFERMLEIGSEKMPFLNFRGHIGQAPPHVQNFINRYYPGDEFQYFLRNHNDVFFLDDELKVSLMPLQD